MKITSTGITALPAAAPVPDTTAAAAQAAAPLDEPERASGMLEAAQSALRAMPEIDEAKVAALRDALARGEIRFDAGKLAGLITRYHGGRE
ncbi:flagellar biosynthesis anti-sigma factor FlgM [Acidovorax sp.]|uniref:flagellar biosynthesis anti-sigma factor FlgM n=1 Tax=Acidovorax sp. TaxID=1872122 RepID=UPI002ACE49C4|nr:flagellar biosynthesis anti-sigma factor FlgM [Acidovorax sp.]MDZ7862158.1 flagellar biosynthesis anti-sigma factor FlgM [Acidovorax sp.]